MQEDLKNERRERAETMAALEAAQEALKLQEKAEAELKEELADKEEMIEGQVCVLCGVVCLQ